MGTIDDVKARLDIVDVVSQYVALNKAGRNFKAPCPFHTERTPSFFVFPERQSWRCFGACADGGDLFSFIMKEEKLEFGDALRLMAQRAGVALEERRSEGENETLYGINEEAARYFQDLLASSQGQKTVSYLEGRGVNPDAISTFRLGLSPAGWDDLKRHLLTLGFQEGKLVEAGLLNRGEDGSTRDLFRGRLMFPIHDRKGRIAGFGGRSLDESQPKYLNSPRTPIFDKGATFYALHLASEAIRKEGLGVIVEGYMDAIAAHQHGFRNVVASMGTALTGQQVAQLRRLANSFVLALDPDTAGQEATLRSLESSWRVLERQAISRRSQGGSTFIQRQTLTLKMASLPQGKDPDQVIKESPEEWQRLLGEAMPLMDYLFGVMVSRFDLSTSQGKAQATEALFPVIASMDNPYDQDHYRQKLAQVLGVSVATLEASAGRSLVGSRRQAQRRSAQPASISPFETDKRDPLEEYTLALLLQRPELRERVEELSFEYFHRSENREVFTSMVKCSIVGSLRESLDQILQTHVDYLIEKPLPPYDRRTAEEAIGGCLRHLEERHLRELKVQEEALLADEGLEGLKEQVLARNDRLKEIFSQPPPQKMRSS